MELQAITLMEAYIIENLRKQGVSKEEIINVDKQSIAKWKKLDDRFDFSMLEKLAEQLGDQFASIIRDGYTVKFLTLNGLINLIQLKFDQKRDVDFAVHDDGISKLDLDDNERTVVQQLLSPNWKVTEENNRLSIRAAHS